MQNKLVIFKLSIKSSYNQNIEQPADKVFDTLQFFVHGKDIFRIKTYAVDHDIHIHKVNVGDRTIDETLDFLTSTTKAHYEDAIEKIVTINIKDVKDTKAIKESLKKELKTAHIESTNDILYWNPDGEPYKNQSNPLV